MGLLSWLFPTEADRLASARSLMAKGRYEDARKKLVHCSLPEAEKLYDECSAKVDAADQVTLKKRLKAEGFRGWRAEVTASDARLKAALEAAIAKELAAARVDLDGAEVDEAAVKAAVARAQRKVQSRGRTGAASVKLVPTMAEGRGNR
jgi:hypothetical protein